MKRRKFLDYLGKFLVASSLYPTNIVKPYITVEPNFELEGVYIVSGPRDRLDDKNKNVRADCKPEIHCVVKAKHDGKIYYLSDVEKVVINGKEIHPKDVKGLNMKIEWYKVEPKDRFYINSSTPQWWDTPRYEETPMKDGVFGMEADVTPTILENYGNIGTMRFKVKIEYKGQKLTTPGKEAVDERGIKECVHRVSIRPDDTYLGWLDSFRNIPYIWGSASLKGQEPPEEHQAEKYIGADCADLLVAAWRAMGHRDVPYYYSGGFKPDGFYVKEGFAWVIIEKAYLVGSVFYDEKTQRAIRIGEGRRKVKEGDIIYFGGHVGVLSKNNGLEGFLDKYDSYFDILFHEPMDREFRDGYSMTFSVLRWME